MAVSGLNSEARRYLVCNIDLQPDLRPSARSRQLDKPLLKLKSSKPEGQKVSAHNKVVWQNWESDQDPTVELTWFQCIPFLPSN